MAERDVWILGASMTKFGRYPDRDLVDLGAEAALGALDDAGVGIAPILPGITDGVDNLSAVMRAARDAGATHVWCNLLYLRPGTREHFLEHLARDWPALLPRYERLYRGRAYLRHADAEPVRALVGRLREQYGIADRRRVRLEPPPEPEQLSLAV